MITSKALLSTLALTVAGTVASGCTLFKRNDAQSSANEAADAVRENADAQADAARDAATREADAVRNAGENTAGAIENGAGGAVGAAANAADAAADKVENASEQQADAIERAGAQVAGTTRDQAELLAEAIEKCPVIGLKDSKTYLTATSGEYLTSASKSGTYSCFTSENEAKQAGFLASAGTGTRAQ